MINDNNIMSLCDLDDNNNEFIYLIKEREFIKTKEPIYKIGKTKQENLQRIKSYPNGSILLLYIITNDCDKKEKEIIQKFKEHFIHKKDIGNEYFMGDYNHMINIILSIISISSNESPLIESSLIESSLIESSLIESPLIESIVYFDYDNKIINFDNSHIKDIEFIKNDKLEYYELFELYYNKLFENENNKIIKKTNKSYSKILTKTKQWINKMDESIYPIIINNIAKNMKSFIEINFKDDINDYNDNKDNIDYTDINYYNDIINILYKILCFLDFIIKITSKNENLLFRDLNKYISIINYKNYLNEFDNSYKLNIKQLKLLFTI
jgi:hypothetical protein